MLYPEEPSRIRDQILARAQPDQTKDLEDFEGLTPRQLQVLTALEHRIKATLDSNPSATDVGGLISKEEHEKRKHERAAITAKRKTSKQVTVTMSGTPLPALPIGWVTRWRSHSKC